MIEKKEVSPFEIIAVALAFSPRIHLLLNEAKCIAERANAKLILIHVGEKKQKKQSADEQFFYDIINKLKIKVPYKIVWREGKAADVILQVCKEECVNLLILGALQKEGLLKYYIGSIARTICRKAQCSILLMSNPKNNCTHFKKIIVSGVEHHKTEQTIKTAFYFANLVETNEITIVEEVAPNSVGITVEDNESLKKSLEIKKNVEIKESKRINSILSQIKGKEKFIIKNKCIFGKKGYTIGHFAQTQKSDLLVINSPDTKLGFIDRVFPHDLEYILSDLPTNLLIVH